VLNLEAVESLKLKELTVIGIKGYEGNIFSSGLKTVGIWKEEEDRESLEESVLKSLK
jgi:hypothetical protein